MYCRHLQYTRAIATCADHQHQRRAPSFPTTPTVTAGGRSDARPLPPAATPPPGQPPLVVRRGPTHACILSMFIARRRPPSAALLPPRGLGKPAAAGRRKKKNRRKKKKRFGWPPRRNSPPSASSWPQRAALPGGDLAAPLPTNAAPGRQPRGYAPPPPPPPHGHHDQNDSGHSMASAGVAKERRRWHLVRLQAHRPPPTYALHKAAAGRRRPQLQASRAVPGYPAERRPCRPRSCVSYSL